MNENNSIKEVVKEAQKGSRISYGRIVDEYKDKIYGLALGMTKDSAEAEELAQRVFVKVLTKIDRYNFRSSFDTWLFRVAHNTIIDHFRKESRQAKRLAPVERFHHLTGGKEPEESARQEKTKEKVMEAVDRLPEKMRAVVIYYHFEDMDYKKIAEIIGKPEGTVKSRLYRARKLLEKDLRNFFGEANV